MKPIFETLEGRQLMATDLELQIGLPTSHHQFDFDQNGHVDAMDALRVANNLQQVPGASQFADTNEDGLLSELDFDCVVQFINSQNSGSKSPGSNESVFSAQAKGGAPRLPFEYWRIGASADDSGVASSGGLGLVGGGADVDAVFHWMGAKAMGNDLTGGDLLVIRATGTDAYNTYIDALVPGLNSVATLLIPDMNAAIDSRVANIINQAEAIFIAGGDQADYARFWNETPVEQAIYDAMQRNVPVGGTSAGLAVLGDFDFTAFSGKTIVSNDALVNPYNRALTIDGSGGDGFLTTREVTAMAQPTTFSLMNLMSDTITDSHFRQRDRMGRLIAFMARIDADGLADGPTIRGIGINEQTALLVEPNGMATVVANPPGTGEDTRSVYVLQHDTGIERTLSSPLEYSNVSVMRANSDGLSGASFSLLSLPTSGTGIEAYTINATGRVTKKIAELTETSLGGLYGDDSAMMA